MYGEVVKTDAIVEFRFARVSRGVRCRATVSKLRHDLRFLWS